MTVIFLAVHKRSEVTAACRQGVRHCFHFPVEIRGAARKSPSLTPRDSVRILIKYTITQALDEPQNSGRGARLWVVWGQSFAGFKCISK